MRRTKSTAILYFILCGLLGVVFLFSAWSKTEPISYFEFIIADQLKVSNTVAAVSARAIIGLEAALGLLLLCSTLGYKRWVLKLSSFLLLIFSVHLLYLLLTVGNDVNCGCMGSVAPMSPAVSLAKNAIMLALCFVLLRRYKPKDATLVSWLTIPVTLSLIALPFFLFPAGAPIKLPISKLYDSQNAPSDPKIDLRKGKHIVCFMSLGCSHCRDAATVLSQMKTKNEKLPIHISFATQENDTMRQVKLDDFLDETKATNLPYQFLYQPAFFDMVKASGSNGVPVILWMEDTTVVRKLNLHELNLTEIENWVNK